MYIEALRRSLGDARMGKATGWLKGLLRLKKHEDSATTGTRKKGGRSRNSGRRGLTKTESDEQSKHAMAITAAAADAAVAVAHAAMALVRLTSHGSGAMFVGAREKWAATLIQSAFRGFLVSIALFLHVLRVLCTMNLCLEPSQARKALRALKGLVKLQALVRGYVVRKRTAENLRRLEALIFHGHRARPCRCSLSYHHNTSPRSMEKHEEYYSQQPFSSPLRVFRCGSPKADAESRRRRIRIPDYGDDYWYQKISSFSCRIPTNSESRHFHTGSMEEDCSKFPTAQTTPRFSGWGNSPATPSKSVCGEGLFGASPNYMVDTQSFRAKLRSKSAPRQRPESEPKRKLSFMASRMIFNGARFRRAKFPQVER